MTNARGMWECKYKCGMEYHTLPECHKHENKCPKKPKARGKK